MLAALWFSCSVLADASFPGAQVEYYDVPAPGGHTAHANWYLSYTYRTRSVPGSCAVESVSTKLDLKVRMPRWNAPPNAAADLVGRWQRYLDGLRVHEDGHLQVGRDFESNFKRAALNMSAPDCGALDSLVQERFDALLEQSHRRDRGYDESTRHGATQGAYFQ
jgi:predicted secreted Zn-dependent protease